MQFREDKSFMSLNDHMVISNLMSPNGSPSGLQAASDGMKSATFEIRADSMTQKNYAEPLETHAHVFGIHSMCCYEMLFLRIVRLCLYEGYTHNKSS